MLQIFRHTKARTHDNDGHELVPMTTRLPSFSSLQALFQKEKLLLFLMSPDRQRPYQGPRNSSWQRASDACRYP
ncbi:hypothetical protein TNCV_2375501 [Trichonephila clavipes]|nr:hypothetical protein TNCV_2375501 [Trichonephila clavipes]